MPHSLSLRSHHWPVQLLGPLALFRCTRTQKFFKQVACFSCTHTHTCISMHMDTSIHIHVHTCIYPHTYLHSIHTHTRPHACSNVYMCECMCLHRCYIHMWARTITCTYIRIHIYTYIYAYISICLDTLWHSERLLEPLRQGDASDNWPFCSWSQQGPRGERGGRSVGCPPDPGPAGLRLGDMEVSRSFVLASLGSSPSGQAVSTARTLITNSFHSASLLELHNLLVTKLNHILMARKE